MSNATEASSIESHWRGLQLSIVFALSVLAAIVYRNLDGGEMPTTRLAANRPTLNFGWPFILAERTWNFTVPLTHEGRFLFLDAGLINNQPATTTHFYASGVVGNVAIGVVIVVAGAYAFTHWSRRGKPRFSIAGLLAIIGVVASLLARDEDLPLQTIHWLTTFILVGALGLAWIAIFHVIGLAIRRFAATSEFSA